VAPYVDESKEWKTSEAVKAYCMKYNVLIPWTVQRHMTKYRVNYLNKKRKETAATADDNQYSFDNKIGP